MKMDEAYWCGRQTLERADVEDAKVDAWYLLEYVTKISRADYFKDPKAELTKEQELRYLLYIEKRAQRIPLQHITGEQDFMGLSFLVNEFVLIPRQDTEVLVENALDLLRCHVREEQEPEPLRILDMCTGSGCILLSLMHYVKEEMPHLEVEGIGADISNEALQVARENAERLKLSANWVHGDLFSKVEGRFGMIVSNPPYIETAVIEGLQEEVRFHDPRIALDGKEDGLYFFKRIVAECGEHLMPGGRVLMEIGYDQAKAVTELMREAGFFDVTVKKDLAGLDRVVTGVYDILSVK